MLNQPKIIQAVKILTNGGLVAFPTETVYGLGADASQELAVRKIFQVKKRPSHHPLIVHIAKAQELNEWAKEISPYAAQLAKAFWPGPLTLILPKKAHVLDSVTGGQETIGLRIPHHPIALALLTAFGKGLAAPSANLFTHLSPTCAKAVEEELGERVDLILDGDDCTVGLESTIVDLTKDIPIILRPGMISGEMIEKVLHVTPLSEGSSDTIRTPGMHPIHYSPTTKTQLIATHDIEKMLQTYQYSKQAIALLSHSPLTIPRPFFLHHTQLANDPINYAHKLYQSLRDLDHQAVECIFIEAVPPTTEWNAIRDRLFKASGGRFYFA